MMALAPLSLEIDRHEKLVLLGNNGSGKSTLLRILAGLYFPRGSYLLDGESVTKKSIGTAFRKRVGVLFQNPESMLFNPTVYDEIAFSLREFGMDRVDARVREIAASFGIEGLLEKNPLQLSGGEKQKVMLAAILVYEPDILLLDEPTAAMDPRTTGWFIDFVLTLEKSVVIATHDLNLAYEVSERAVVLNEAHEKIYDGDIERLFEDVDLLLEANLIHKHKHKHKKWSHSHYHLHF
jgi:cobalt/nickel transport system ATP-binding protein